eukprot:TRINITY_DN28914_c0_g1_i1.p1 TRINITY_DN28914_c0_g1~~TRINITY_DN28914_c0_g1_i1.p1  ORF type:complete len:218 (-),score=55.77 TRINITY_DN28914_c0_g1_i1:294-947(-)
MTEAASSRRRSVALGAAAAAAFASLLALPRLRRRWLKRRREDELHAGGWLRVGHTRDLQPGPHGWLAMPFTFAGGADACALRRTDSDAGEGKALPQAGGEGQTLWCAFSRSCPHAGLDLLGGDVEDLGNGPVIACPAHTYLFDAHTGACLWDAARGQPPPTQPLQAFEIVEEPDGGVWAKPKDKPPQPAPEEWDQVKADLLQLEIVDRVLARKFPDD